MPVTDLPTMAFMVGLFFGLALGITASHMIAFAVEQLTKLLYRDHKLCDRCGAEMRR